MKVSGAGAVNPSDAGQAILVAEGFHMHVAAQQVRALGHYAPPSVAGPLGPQAGVVGLVRGPACGFEGDALVGLLDDLHARPVGHILAEALQVEYAPHAEAVDVGGVVVAGVLNGEAPVHGPDRAVGVDDVGRVEELLGHVFFDGDGFRLPHPDEHHIAHHDRGVGAGLHLAHLAGFRSLGEGGNAVAILVEGVAVVGAADGAVELAAALGGKDGPTVGASVPEGGDFALAIGALLAFEEDYVLAHDVCPYGLAPAEEAEGALAELF